jgi:hypothetical protein
MDAKKRHLVLFAALSLFSAEPKRHERPDLRDADGAET